jgi:hypothetical protein
MWQVVCVVRSYEEKYEHAMEGEVFATEAEADARADELDATRAVWPDYFIAKEV